MPWEAISAALTLIQTVVVVIAVIYAIEQVRESQRGRTLGAFLPLVEKLNSPESVELRKKLYTELGDDPEKYSVEQELIVNEIVNQIDFLGFLVDQKLVDFETIAPFYYGTVIRCWQKSSPYVFYQRELRTTKFARFFEQLSSRCENYLKMQRPDETITAYHGIAQSNKKDS